MIPFAIFAQICTLVLATTPGETVRFVSDGNAVYAVDATTDRPVWSDDGLIFRECYDPRFQDDEEDEETGTPQRGASGAIDVPMLVRHGRLYVILEKRLEKRIENLSERDTAREDVRGGGNVLVALDLRSQGKLVWRLDSTVVLRDGRARWTGFRSLDGDRLAVEHDAAGDGVAGDGVAGGAPSVIYVDVASGTTREP